MKFPEGEENTVLHLYLHLQPSESEKKAWLNFSHFDLIIAFGSTFFSVVI